MPRISVAYCFPDSAGFTIVHKKARKLHRTYFQKAGSGMTSGNKIDTHLPSLYAFTHSD